MSRKPLGPESIFRHLPAALRKLRKDKGLKLEEVARLAGLSRATVSRYELGEGSPTILNLIALKHALGATDGRLIKTLTELDGNTREIGGLPLDATPAHLLPEDRLLAVWARHVENGQGDLWLAQTEAQLARVKAVRDLMRTVPGPGPEDEKGDAPADEPQADGPEES
jgi:transcriptional regulator with XRE-family HTH domain